MNLKIILGVVVATIVGLFAMQFIDPNLPGGIFHNKNKGNGNDSQIVDETKAKYTITGKVKSPGTYYLSKENASMNDLIVAAGGIETTADDRCFYPEAVLKPGKSYYIPVKYDETDICGGSELPKVNINVAPANKIVEINGVGKVIAQAIVNFRSKNGLFKTLEDLYEVNGIGPSVFIKLQDHVILHE